MKASFLAKRNREMYRAQLTFFNILGTYNHLKEDKRENERWVNKEISEMNKKPYIENGRISRMIQYPLGYPQTSVCPD